MSHMPLISIALCTYNGERYLSEQLESILKQTYTNLEIVIVDDCSTDQTESIIKNYARKDQRIQFFKNKKNVGFVKNFQRALQKCNGELIALSDQDDIWLPEKIETLYREIENNLLIYSAVKLIDSRGKPLKRTFPNVCRLEGACAMSLLLGNCVTGHACLLRRDLLDEALPLPEGIPVHDQWLAIVAAAHGKLRASNHTLSWYRAHDNNVMLSTQKKRTTSKAQKALNKNRHLLALGEALLQLDLLDKADQEKLSNFLQLLAINRRVVYNWRLARFLKHYKSDFLKLYRTPESQIRKICRGYWYYRLFPFI